MCTPVKGEWTYYSIQCFVEICLDKMLHVESSYYKILVRKHEVDN